MWDTTLGISLISYAGDNNGCLPTPDLSWMFGWIGTEVVYSPLYTANQNSTATFMYNSLSPYIAGNGRLFYCPSQRFQYPGIPVEYNYANRFPVVVNNGYDTMPVIHYTGNPYYQLDRDPKLRGNYIFGSTRGI